MAELMLIKDGYVSRSDFEVLQEKLKLLASTSMTQPLAQVITDAELIEGILRSGWRLEVVEGK